MITFKLIWEIATQQSFMLSDSGGAFVMLLKGESIVFVRFVKSEELIISIRFCMFV